MFIEYLSRKRDSLKAWVGKLLMPVVTVMLLVGMTMAGNVWAASSCDVVKSGLVACYPFDGNANDASANGNHGTVNGAILNADRFGKPNSSYQFDNVNDAIHAKAIPLKQQTISAWVYPRVTTLRGDIVVVENSDSSSTADYGIYLTTTNGNTFRPYYFIRSSDGSAYYIAFSAQPIQVNQWYFLVATYDGYVAKFYLDGQIVASQELQLNLRQTGVVLGIGNDYSINAGDPAMNGIIDDLRIYNRALTETEIKELYQLKDSPPKTCEHAVYSVTNNIGKLVIPFVEIPLLNLYTHLPTGELAVFSGELKQVGSSMDFGLVSSKLKLIFLTTAADPCRAVYDETQKTLHTPFVDVGNEVYDVKFQHLKDIPLELGVFHLESYDLVQ